MQFPSVPQAARGRRFVGVSNYTGWDFFLYMAPGCWQARVAARRIIRHDWGGRVPDGGLLLQIADGRLYEVLSAGGRVREVRG